jgi:translation initiation factor IF-3
VGPISKGLRVNERIRIKEVRVIGQDGTQLGILPIEQALQTAFDLHLDLVEVAPEARPPVCRIMDYGKFRYEQSKKAGRRRRSRRSSSSRRSNSARRRRSMISSSRRDTPNAS